MGKESSCLGRAKAIANMEEWGFFLGGGGGVFFWFVPSLTQLPWFPLP